MDLGLVDGVTRLFLLHTMRYTHNCRIQVESHVAWNERHRGEAERAQREVMEVCQWALAGAGVFV